MSHTDERLATDFKLLLLIDRRRAETGDPNLGSAIESVILGRWLTGIERASGFLQETRPAA